MTTETQLDAKTLEELEKKYDEVVLVVGSDRVEDFKQLLRKGSHPYIRAAI